MKGSEAEVKGSAVAVKGSGRGLGDGSGSGSGVGVASASASAWSRGWSGGGRGGGSERARGARARAGSRKGREGWSSLVVVGFGVVVRVEVDVEHDAAVVGDAEGTLVLPERGASADARGASAVRARRSNA